MDYVGVVKDEISGKKTKLKKKKVDRKKSPKKQQNFVNRLKILTAKTINAATSGDGRERSLTAARRQQTKR